MTLVPAEPKGGGASEGTQAASAAGAPGPGDGAAGERLQKVLARAGVGSRRACEELIAGGRVKVNGQPARLGQRASAADDHISVDGIPLAVRQGMAYYLVNKPAGVLTTASDTRGRPTVVSLVPCQPRVYPVGRLDWATEGLIVLTNDGELAYRLAHPSFGVEKEYIVEAARPFTPEAVRRLRRGVVLDDGVTAPARVNLLRPDAARVVVHEGRNRQVRRMCEAVGCPVLRLVRSRLGPLRDPALGPGQWRHLSPAEVTQLWAAAGGGA
jgi:23S rRNA pseudouridine2605 synthase